MDSRLARRRLRTKRYRPLAATIAPVVVERGRSDMERAIDLLVRELGAVEVSRERARA